MICHRCLLPIPRDGTAAEVRIGGSPAVVCEACLHALAARGQIAPPIAISRPTRALSRPLRCLRDGRPIDDPSRAVRVFPRHPAGADPVILCRSCLTDLVIKGLVAWGARGWTFQADPRFRHPDSRVTRDAEWPGDPAFWTPDRVWTLARLDALLGS